MHIHKIDGLRMHLTGNKEWFCRSGTLIDLGIAMLAKSIRKKHSIIVRPITSKPTSYSSTISVATPLELWLSDASRRSKPSWAAKLSLWCWAMMIA